MGPVLNRLGNKKSKKVRSSKIRFYFSIFEQKMFQSDYYHKILTEMFIYKCSIAQFIKANWTYH